MARTPKKAVDNLIKMGLSRSLALQAYAQWGVSASSEIKNDPYALLYLGPSAKWPEIDTIARQIGYDETDPLRIMGAVRYSLLASKTDGHVFLPHRELLSRVRRLVALESEESWHDTLTELDQRREIFVRSHETSELSIPVYLRAMHHAENSIAMNLALLSKSTSRMALQAPSSKDMKNVENDLHVDLAAAQKEAISASLTNKILIITGGPGTGKTTIIRSVIRLWKKRKGKIRLAAPTGRAAKRLAESTERKASTIHRLLEYTPDSNSFQRNTNRKLSTDLMVVDEASMIDTELMAALLEALPASCHLLLAGDVDQLPAVGPGFVLHDLIESKRFKTVFLTDIFRQQEGSLISLNAQKINEGKMPELDGGGVELGQDFFFVQRSSTESTRDTILELVTERIPKQFGFDPKEDIQVLCPMIKKEAGVETMNGLLQERLNPSDAPFKGPFYSFSIGDKIMQTKNDYSKDVFNGDIGFAVDIDPEGRWVTIDFEGRNVDYDWKELENTSLAYAMTVHKSQGSEYPAVVVPLVNDHYPMLQRNLLYTAVSRGKRLVMLTGTTRALETAIRNNRIRARYTGLQELLNEVF